MPSFIWIVDYPGFMQTVRRFFPSRQLAEAWTRKVGKFGVATIRKELDEVGPAISSKRFGNEPHENEQ